jgi:hypothetical protein
MRRGASHWPQYADDSVSHATRSDIGRPSGEQSQYTGHGDYRSLKHQSFDAYAMVDAWRSYREDGTTLSGEHNDRSLNPTASDFSPASSLTNDLQFQAKSHFKPYQPLRSVHSYARYPEYRVTKTTTRFSNGASVAQLLQSFQDSGLNPSYTESRHNYSIRSLSAQAPLPKSVPDPSLSSIEPMANYALESQAGSDELCRNNRRRATPRHTPQRTVTPPPAPKASEVYLAQARLSPVRRSTPKKCLVILDLNGTCIARPDALKPTVFKIRPGIRKLFDYLFKHHVVMIFTSMRHKNATAIVGKLFTPHQRQRLAGFWARDKLGLTTEQLAVKTQTYKNLDPVWLDEAIQSTYPKDEGGWGWDQSNTVLIDDSHLKAVSHPHNLLLVPEFSKEDAANLKRNRVVKKTEGAILQSLIVMLEELKYQTDVSRLILQWQTSKSQLSREPRASTGLPMEKMKITLEEPVQLLTPEITIDELSEDSQDDEVHQMLSAQMKRWAEDEDRRKRGVSEIPETVWADLQDGTDTTA